LRCSIAANSSIDTPMGLCSPPRLSRLSPWLTRLFRRRVASIQAPTQQAASADPRRSVRSGPKASAPFAIPW
jgi:hypothetical protein